VGLGLHVVLIKTVLMFCLLHASVRPNSASTQMTLTVRWLWQTVRVQAHS